MNIWLVEPYYDGSHRAWADGYRVHSRHDVHLLTLPGRFWKWRMEGGAITLARQARALAQQPDLLLASDMLNLPVFLALYGRLPGFPATSGTSPTSGGGSHAAGLPSSSGGGSHAAAPGLAHIPIALYFHENQLTYPVPPGEKRDLHFGFINVASALCADVLLFNSAHHRAEFLDELPRLLKHFPEYNELWIVEALRARSQVLPLGLDLARLDAHRPDQPAAGQPLILWNHRWEYDKDPETFFRAIYALTAESLDFGLILLGESFRNSPGEFLEARRRLGERVVHFGYAQDAALYARLLWQADLVVSTARHDFFGAAVVEACYCGCFPVLPHRLSYPELIPAGQAAACLYDDFDGLLARLRQALLHIHDTRAFSLHEHMAQFDWQHLAPRYDDLLEDVAFGL
jgi:glycosyltransferase involved in cell wall biosynthesis